MFTSCVLQHLSAASAIALEHRRLKMQLESRDKFCTELMGTICFGVRVLTRPKLVEYILPEDSARCIARCSNLVCVHCGGTESNWHTLTRAAKDGVNLKVKDL